jgi:DNA replication licensing factor MCM7
MSVRQLHAGLIGALVSVRAMVVRTSDVKPLIIVACYSCDSCGFESYQTVVSR